MFNISTYNSDTVWRSIQNYLPLKNRLSSDSLPEEYFLSICGMNVHIDHYKSNNSRARIILFHGVGGNGRLLSFIAKPLWNYGYDIICPDLPLYGYTKYKGDITYNHWIEVGSEIVKYFSKDSTPIFLFGLSAGGMLAYQISNECSNISGIIATCILDQRNPLVIKETARSPIIANITKPLISATYKAVKSIKIPMKFVVNMKAISNNDQLTNILIKDTRSSGANVPLSFLHSMINLSIKIEPEEFIQCPFLLAHPEKDNWTDTELSRLFFDRLACKKELVILEKAGHFPIEELGLLQLEHSCIAFIEKILSS